VALVDGNIRALQTWDLGEKFSDFSKNSSEKFILAKILKQYFNIIKLCYSLMIYILN